MAIKGLDNVIRNLNTAIKDIKGGTHEGLVAAGVFIKGESQEIVPVDFGILSNSAFSQAVAPMKVVVGYTAEYAPYTHEMPSSTNWTKPGTGNKFLEKAVKENIPQILKVIQKRAKI